MDIGMIARLGLGVMTCGATGCAAGSVGGGGGGDLGFAPAPGSPYAVGPHPSEAVIADFDGNGNPDIAVACGDGARPETWRVVVLLNDGAGRFPAGGGASGGASGGEGGLDRLRTHVDTIAAADFNSDGRLDLAGVQHDSYEVILFMGDGRAGFAAGPTVLAYDGESPHTHAIACADVNGDGHADILTSNADDDAISVLLGDGKAGFTPAEGSPFAAARHPYAAIAIADLSGDGKPDVAAPLLASHAIGVYLGDGKGGFAQAPGSPHSVGERPGFVCVDDVNGDGRPDILATHDDVGMLDVLLNDGDGRFRVAPGSPRRIGRPGWTVATADFDRDGHTDALMSSQGRGRLTMLLGDGRGGFAEAQVELPTGEEPNYVAAPDLNGDGRPDIVTANYSSGNVTVLLAR